jgi:hypothetical protein
MKKFILILVLFFGFSFAAKGNSNAIGLWLGRGGGWGFDFKHQIDNNNVWDAYLGDFGIGSNETKINLGFGYYWLFNVIKADASIGSFPLHVGPDLGFHWWSGKGYDGFDIGPSVAGGISWFTPTNPKLDVSFELVSPPIVRLWNHKQGDADRDWQFNILEGELGFRLLFHVYLF